MARSSWQPIRILGKGPWSLLPAQTWSVLTDFVIFAAGLSIFYAVLVLARTWFGPFNPHIEISRDPTKLPVYAAYSLLRITVAYVLSLAFTLVYGYVAAYNPRAERIMIPLLDILQSIPVLSFLPGVMLAMVALFPNHQIGVEMGAILLIFTGQVWNMAFSFYSSLKSIPRDMREAAKIYRFNWYQRFTQFELPYAAIGLVWNSMMSVAGGWFFLMACEMFVLGDRDFRLPGLGSYLQTAASAGDTEAIVWGVGTMIAVIVLLDQIVWRPVIAWAEKFKMEQVESADVPRSWFLNLMEASRGLRKLRKKTHQAHSRAARASLCASLSRHGGRRSAGSLESLDRPRDCRPCRDRRVVRRHTSDRHAHRTERRRISRTDDRRGRNVPARGRGANHRRSLDDSRRRRHRIQSQAGAHCAAAGADRGFGSGDSAVSHRAAGADSHWRRIGLGSIVLLLLGTQWYILFNVIAGAMAIPTDLKEASSLCKFSRGQRWRKLILPGIFPYLITGMVTASGGAWNASIVAEYQHLKDQTFTTVGLGATISRATDSGNFDLLLASTIVMSIVVVTINRLVWRRMYRLASTRYTLET